MESPINTSLRMARSIAYPSPANSPGYETTPVIKNAISKEKLTLKRVERPFMEKTGKSQRIASTLKKINIYFGTSMIMKPSARMWKDSKKG